MHYPDHPFKLPDWVKAFTQDQPTHIPDLEKRMQFAVNLSRVNVDRKTGGPFGAAVFETDTGRLVCPGVNLVTHMNCSIAHAEMVALALAQQIVGHYDLSAQGKTHELVTSTEPCAMCLGAIAWSGVQRVVYGASTADAEKIGFDEGHKPAQGTLCLQEQGIEVIPEVLRVEASAVLQHYKNTGGNIYNSGQT
jgi:tRNA(Arg) A34 adenosine deaminase TadA